jgi:hypothetical protein
MRSIFDLPKNVSTDIASKNYGIYSQNMVQVPASRDVTGTSFPNGDLRFKFSVPSGKWWLPDRSYLRAQFTLSNGDDSPIQMTDAISAAQNLCGNLFQTCEIQIDGQTYSRVSSYVSQVSALETRMSKSASWLNSIGSATNFWDSLEVRQVNTSADGSEVGDVPNEELVTLQSALGMGATCEIASTVQDATTSAFITFSVVTRTAAQLKELFPIGSTIRFGAALGGVTDAIVTGHAANVLQLGTSNITSVGAAVVAFSRVQYGAQAARRVKTFEVMWTPPLSVLKITHAIPGSFTGELILQPMPTNSYEKQAIQTVLGTTREAGAGAGDFKLSLINMYYYTHIVEGERVNTESYILDLAQTSCQTQKVLVADSAQYIFEVPQSTTALTFAIQDTRCGSNSSMSPSEFKSYNAAGTDETQNKMIRFSLDYAGQRYPTPDAQPSLSTGVDLSTQQYLNTQMNTGSFYNDGGSETLRQFRSRGSYYHFETPKDARDASTRVLLTIEFAAGTDIVNARVLLFAHSTQLAAINMVDSSIRDAVIGDA